MQNSIPAQTQNRQSEFRAAADRGAQHLPCGKLGNRIAFDEAAGLRSLSRSRRSQHYQPHLFTPCMIFRFHFAPGLEKGCASGAL